MTPDQNRRYHLLLKECGITEDGKAMLIAAFSDGQSTSSKDLKPAAVAGLLRYLQEEHSKRCKPMRGKVIHYLCLLGYTVGKDQADWDRINAFIMGMGSNNPRKVQLNFLYYSELPKVVSQVEAMYKHELNRLK